MSAGVGTAAAVTAIATIYAANKNSDTAEKVADTTSKTATNAATLQSKAAADALAFQKQSAENDFKNQELTRQANYNQWAAREGRVSTFGQMLGLPARNIPAYVPSQDPNYLATQTPNVSPTIGGAAPPGPSTAPTTPQTVPGTAPASVPQGVTAPPNGDYRAFFNQLTGGKPLDQAGLLALKPQLDAAGIKITPPSAAGVVSKIGLPDGTWVRVLNGDTKVASPTVWIPQASGSGGGASSAQQIVGSPAFYAPDNIAPALQMPTFAGMLGR